MLNRETILEALRQLSERLQVREVVGEINLLSGTARVLGFQARQSTKDVDAIFSTSPYRPGGSPCSRRRNGTACRLAQ
jgi:hypothetical protein